MNKRIFLSLALVAMALTMYAIPAKRGIWRTIQLTDGTQVRVQLSGDEHAHFFRDAKGNCYEQDGTAYRLTDISTMARKAQKHRNKAVKTMHRAKALAKNARRKVGGSTGRDYTGTKKGLIILAEFTDKKFEEGHDVALYQRIANEEGFTSGDGFCGSVHDYFSAQSGGRFDLTFDVVGPVPLKNNVSYYGKNTNDSDTRPEEMIVEACQYVDDQVNFADYDWDGDGEADQVFVLYAGLGEAAGGASSTIWPHEYELSQTNRQITLDDVLIDTYACSSELTGIEFNNFSGLATETAIDGIGTICHEFSHCLGYPDMYDINSENYGMGPWDLMDCGSYNGDDRGLMPAGYTSYEKWCAGWLEPTELNSDTQVTGLKALSEGGGAYVIYNDANPDEYYLLENRQPTGWDGALYGRGMLVLHVDYDEEVWIWNVVNTIITKDNYFDYYGVKYGSPYGGPLNDHCRLSIIPADNNLKMDYYEGYGYQIDLDNVYGDPFPYKGNNTLSNTSKPKATLYNPNTDGKKLMNKAVTDITQNADGTISFNFKAVDEGGSEDTSTGTVFHETFDKCSGKGGNDNLWKGTGVASSEFLPDIEGWETHATNVSYGANKCARFGTTSKNGLVMSPTFTLQGQATLTVRVAPWSSGRENGLQIYYANEGAEDFDDLVELFNDALTPDQWNEITLTINGDGENYIIFLPDQRFFLDDVLIAVPEADPTGISDVRPKVRPVGGRIYTIDGRYVGLDFGALKSGIYVIDGKKVVK